MSNCADKIGMILAVINYWEIATLLLLAGVYVVGVLGTWLLYDLTHNFLSPNYKSPNGMDSLAILLWPISLLSMIVWKLLNPSGRNKKKHWF